MIIKIKELKDNMSVIYKINYKDGKHFYIGFTNDLKRRMSEHINAYKKIKYKKIQDCDMAIFEQGGLEEIEILEFCKEKDLANREKYWISYYDAYNSPLGYNKTKGGDGSDQIGENNPNSVFSNQEVYNIRKRRYLGERKKDVYQDYSNYSFQTFEKIWLGRGYTEIGKEFLIPSNLKSRQEYSHEANNGLKNGRAKASLEDIKTIRKRYDNGEKIVDILKDFNYLSKSTIRRIALRETFKDIK